MDRFLHSVASVHPIPFNFILHHGVKSFPRDSSGGHLYPATRGAQSLTRTHFRAAARFDPYEQARMASAERGCLGRRARSRARGVSVRGTAFGLESNEGQSDLPGTFPLCDARVQAPGGHAASPSVRVTLQGNVTFGLQGRHGRPSLHCTCCSPPPQVPVSGGWAEVAPHEVQRKGRG